MSDLLPGILRGRRRGVGGLGSALDVGDEHAMAYAQLTASRVRDAAQAALQEMETRLASGDATGQDRADSVRLRWILDLATASAQEDDAHAFLTVTAEDFNAIAGHYKAAG